MKISNIYSDITIFLQNRTKIPPDRSIWRGLKDELDGLIVQILDKIGSGHYIEMNAIGIELPLMILYQL